MDLSTVIDWAIQGLKKLSGSTILSIISIFIAVSVFRFNKKMGYSKLSVLPMVYKRNQIPAVSSLDFTYHLWKLTYAQESRGLPVDMVERKTLEADKYKDMVFSHNRFVNELLTIKLKNKGELASTNIKIVLVFKAYGSKIKYVKNEKDILNWKSSRRKVFSKRKIVINVPYIGADDEKEFVIIDLREQFRESELILCRVKANGHNYFREKLLSKIFNRVVINHNVHPYLRESGDGSDLNVLLGLAYKEEKWIDPYKRYWIGEMISCLRNLYAEWRK